MENQVVNLKISENFLNIQIKIVFQLLQLINQKNTF